MSPSDGVVAAIAAAEGLEAMGRRPRWQAIGGGSINAAGRLAMAGRDFFVKLNDDDGLDMFEAEAAALGELAACRDLRVPAVVTLGRVDGRAFLALEYIALRPLGPSAGRRLGQGLAALHGLTAGAHGWWRDNTIGLTSQSNRRTADWRAFWRDERLAPQLAMARERGGGARLERLGERLLEALPALFEGHRPAPSLLHGDLWSGNAAADPEGRPVVFDPASYYGDRETDLAMSELFGGFPPDFLAAYDAAWPVDSGYARRRPLYQLYHVLNHYNLFGGGYLSQACSLIELLLRGG